MAEILNPEIRQPEAAEQFIETHTVLPSGEQLAITTYRQQENAPDVLRFTTQRVNAEDEANAQVVRVFPEHRMAFITKSGDRVTAYVLQAQKGTLFRKGSFDMHSFQLINSRGEWGVLKDTHDTAPGDVMVSLENMDWVKVVGIDNESAEGDKPEAINATKLPDGQREDFLLPGQALDAVRQHLIHN